MVLKDSLKDNHEPAGEHHVAKTDNLYEVQKNINASALLEDLDKYISRKFIEQEPTEDLEILKDLVKADMKRVIQSDGKKGKDMIKHFYNEMRHCTDYACPYCNRYFAQNSTMQIHKKKHEKGLVFADLPNVPSFDRKFRTCLICGLRDVSRDTIATHIIEDHDEVTRRQFGLGSVSQI